MEHKIAEQNEKAFQKQDAVFLAGKRTLAKNGKKVSSKTSSGLFHAGEVRLLSEREQ